MKDVSAKPCVVRLVGGVSGAGKSETAAALARRLGIGWLQADDRGAAKRVAC